MTLTADALGALEIAWRPTADALRNSPVGRLAFAMGIDTYEELAARAAADPAWFWTAVADDIGVRWARPFTSALDLSRGPEFPTFFKGGELNIAYAAVDRWVADGRSEDVAIRWYVDGPESESITFGVLRQRVLDAVGMLRSVGVREGDRVGIYLPMIPEAAVALLATARIGAIAVPMFSGYGAEAVRTRLDDAGAKVLITCDAFPRRGRLVPAKTVADGAVATLPGVQKVIVVRRSGTDVPMRTPRDVYWDEAAMPGSTADEPSAFGVETPCLLLYTSGSTGRPKGCVHTHTGLPLAVAAEARYGFGADQDCAILWLTDMGWVMGPWLVFASLINGGTCVLFEGVPNYPAPDRLWEVTAASRTTILGIAPTVVRSLMAEGHQWPARHDLSSLRAIGSTGEPWNLDPWWWCFRHVGRARVPIVNIRGATACGGSRLSGSIVRPVKPTSFCGPVLGIPADVVGGDGRSMTGEVGELVVRGPWPGMTKGFWNDPERYLETYWQAFPGVWQHGDFACVDSDGFWFVLGRSDDTIKVAGKRLGPAEVESAMQSTGLVVESAAVGLRHAEKGEALACFAVLRADAPATAVTELETAVEKTFGKALRPTLVVAVTALPKTRNGKVMRRVIRRAVLDEPVGDISALEDPSIIQMLTTLDEAVSWRDALGQSSRNR